MLAPTSACVILNFLFVICRLHFVISIILFLLLSIDIVSSGKVVYGVNTGFGNFADVIIPNDKLEQLQENLIRSHAAGLFLF